MKQAVVILICLLGFPGILFSAAPPMVEKHIFLPEKPAEKKQVISGDDLKEKLMFTGILISPKGKYAFVKGKKKKPDEPVKTILQEGDEIEGAVITGIFPNRIVLLNNGKEVHLKLYSGDKKRPAPVKTQAPPVIQAGTATGAGADQTREGTSAGSGAETSQGDAASAAAGRSPAETLNEKIRQKQAEQGIKTDKGSNPFAEALKKAIERKQSSGSAPPVSNPFLEAIKKAQQRKQ